MNPKTMKNQYPQFNPTPDKPWLITGPSGCGKSYVIEEMARFYGVQCADLDDIGHHEEKNGQPRWIVRLPEFARVFALKKYSIYCLVSDNLDEIMKHFKVVVLVRVGDDTLKRVVAKKIATYDEENPESKKKGTDIWTNTNTADIQYAQFIAHWIAPWWKHKDSDFYIVDNDRKKEAGYVWHGMDTDVRQERKKTLREEAKYVKTVKAW